MCVTLLSTFCRFDSFHNKILSLKRIFPGCTSAYSYTQFFHPIDAANLPHRSLTLGLSLLPPAHSCVCLFPAGFCPSPHWTCPGPDPHRFHAAHPAVTFHTGGHSFLSKPSCLSASTTLASPGFLLPRQTLLALLHFLLSLLTLGSLGS